MIVKVITPPTIEPLTLAEAKAQCRVDTSDEDTLITGLITTARELAEAWDWRAYLTQTIELWCETWPTGDMLELPRPPLQSVTKIEYYGTDDIKYTLATTIYGVDTNRTPGTVRLKYNQAWPTTALRPYSSICVTYVAGWTAAAYVPKTIKQALQLLVGHWFENREATISGTVSRPVDLAVQDLLGVKRVRKF